MKNSKVLSFNNQNQPQIEAGLLKVIESVIEQKLKSLTARARLACQTLTADEVEGLEKQAMENFFSSQRIATPEINDAFTRIDVKGFQTIAVQIAVFVAGNNFESAVELFQETVANFAGRIAKILLPETATADRVRFAA